MSAFVMNRSVGLNVKSLFARLLYYSFCAIFGAMRRHGYLSSSAPHNFPGEIENRRHYMRLFFRAFVGLIIYFILLSLLIWYEKDSTQSAITNYPNAIWYSVVTLTSVGYGDIYPMTIYGRLIGYVFVLVSLGVYALLISQFGNIMMTIRENKKKGYNGTIMKNHAIIIGWNDFGKAVTEQLLGVGKPLAVVTDKESDLETINGLFGSAGLYVLFSDFENYDLINKANISESSMVFVNLNDDTAKLVYILNLKKRYENLNYIVTLDNGDLKDFYGSNKSSHIIFFILSVLVDT
ncbi:MAG: potassium channel family protein, partial [Bacteroidetes bacterium]|nr:potassium channel family protein [Bacteroidota bacterium]